MSVQLATDRVSVLVVDDSEDQRDLLRRHFERAGCDVITAATAEEALLIVDMDRPELMVIDLLLPGIDGWELARHMRTDYPDCPVAITSVLQENAYPEAHASLPKPFSGAHVRRVLGECVPRWAAA
jgi:CheY-like chemotaxis protein